MSHVKSMLEQIKINYQINDIGNSCCTSLVGVESKENWAIGHRLKHFQKRNLDYVFPNSMSVLRYWQKDCENLVRTFWGW